jgi:hypothetical protein
MATPAKRTEPRLPVQHTPDRYTPVEPVPVVAPFGWMLCLAAGIGLMLSTWTLYPLDAPGMWAGYYDGIIATVAIIAAMALTTRLPEAPSLVVLGLCGVALVLLALFLDNPHVVTVSELAAGIVMLLGTALQAAGRRP